MIAKLRRPLGILVASLALLGPLALGQGTAWAQPGSLADCPRLAEGQSGPCVALLQESLNELDVGYDLTVDGRFGSGTRIALLDFQGRNRLPADGLAGRKTLDALALQTEAVPSPSPGRPSPVVVALGDSYSSGEGADYDGVGYESGTASGGNGCHRAETAWPRLSGVPVELHLACSGATSTTIVGGGGKDTEGSQTDRLATIEEELRRQGRQVDIVTVTVGGNDVGFSRIIGDCWKNDNCLAGFMKDINQHEATLMAGARNTLTRIRSAAPGATVVLVGYPRLVPADDRPAVNCGWLTPTERRRVNELASRVDSALRQVADQEGARYASTLDVLSGHELCTRDSWLVPVQPFALHPSRPEQGHPTREGQNAMAVVTRPIIAN